jgi:hypothetical protein
MPNVLSSAIFAARAATLPLGGMVSARRGRGERLGQELSTKRETRRRLKRFRARVADSRLEKR